MKKKFRLWLNIVTICLCVCAIAIGVYAATSATLTVSGQIGFTAHECEVSVDLTKQGYATNAELTEYQKTATPVDLATSDNTTTTGTIGGQNATVTSPVNLGTLNFTDIADTTIPDIIFTVTVENKSPYPVAAVLLVDDISNVQPIRQVSYNNGETTNHAEAVILQAKNTGNDTDKAVFTLTLRVSDPNVSIDPTEDVNIKVSFAKYTYKTLSQGEKITDTTTSPGLIYTLNEAQTAWSVTGDYEYDASSFTIINNKVPNEVVIEPIVQGLPVTVIGREAFANEEALLDVGNITRITIPTSIVKIGSYALYSTGEIGEDSYILPNSLIEIGDSAFTACSNFTEINIPDNVTTIGILAFANAGDILVKIGKNITQLGDSAFLYSATTIIISAITPPSFVGGYAFERSNYSEFDKLKIYVPAESVDAYKEAWTYYADHIYAIEY